MKKILAVLLILLLILILVLVVRTVTYKFGKVPKNADDKELVQSPNQKIPDRKTKCVIETHLNIKQNVIFGANLKPV